MLQSQWHVAEGPPRPSQQVTCCTSPTTASLHWCCYLHCGHTPTMEKWVTSLNFPSPGGNRYNTAGCPFCCSEGESSGNDDGLQGGLSVIVVTAREMKGPTSLWSDRPAFVARGKKLLCHVPGGTSTIAFSFSDPFKFFHVNLIKHFFFFIWAPFRSEEA